MRWLIQKDKLLHLLAGIIMVQLLYVVADLIWCRMAALAFSLVVATSVMAAKEIWWDKILGRGVASGRDFLAGMIGIIYSVIIILFL